MPGVVDSCLNRLPILQKGTSNSCGGALAKEFTAHISQRVDREKQTPKYKEDSNHS